MLLTISTTHRPATDLGYLLHKHPGKLQTFGLPFGQAHVFYPEAADARCTAALLLDVDPVGLVRGTGATLDEYVNDRPYVASSHLSVALADVFRSALGGRCKDRPDLVDVPLPFEVEVGAVPVRGGDDLPERLFGPLGYTVEATPEPLDPAFPEWGVAPYVRLRLAGTVRLADLLAHLYVLVPVLDGRKHYYVGDDEVAKLVAKGAGWLAAHPERRLVAAGYLRRRTSLVRAALEQLLGDEAPEVLANEEPAVEASEGDGAGDVGAAAEPSSAAEEPETPMQAERRSLHDQRLDAAAAVLKASGAARVLDLGCGEGRLLKRLLADRQFTDVVGMDVSHAALERAERRLRVDRMPPLQRRRLTLLHGSLVYRDDRLAGFDAAAVVEVVEHLDPARLDAFERVVFAEARPGLVALTTPNRDHNARYPALPAGTFRHADHRFEWSRAEFAEWAERVAVAHGYGVRVEGVGPEDAAHGAPSQMAVFERLP